MDTLQSSWPAILDLVRQKVSQQTYDTWFLPLKLSSGSNGTLEVHCPDRFFEDWFSEHHLHTLAEATADHFAREIAIRLTVREGTASPPERFSAAATVSSHRARDGRAPEVVVDGPTLDEPAEESRQACPFLNPDYTFGSFVVGSGSKMAFAAAQAICKKPGDNFNPLFVYGGVGLGKTHLMHAIGNAIYAAHPDKRIVYVTSEQFMNELIFDISRNQSYKFRQKYRTVDVLLVDDVTFWAGKESTQDEFFHTFNTLYTEKKQIILTSDRPPKEITTLEERLRSRFEWGLICDVQSPDLETRIAILRKKVEANNIYIGDDVIQYIAENITDNIRRLEGALIRLLAFASLTAQDINLDLASEVLSSFFQADAKRPTRIADVMTLVASYYDMTVDQLKSKKRTKDLALARQVAMFVAREKTGASLNQIGRAFGNRDHTTVLHACQKIKGKLEEQPAFRGEVKDIFDNL